MSKDSRSCRACACAGRRNVPADFPDCTGKGFFRENAFRLFSFLMLAAGLLFQSVSCPWFGKGNTALFWFLLAYFPVAFPVMKDAWRSFSEKDFFNEFTLMLIASIGAFFIGEYPEAVAVMLFYSVGERLQEKAVARSRRGIRDLLGGRIDKVQVLRNGAWVWVEAGNVEEGERIRLAVGERLCLDARLLSGPACFDTSALTGESLPREVEKGREILAGCVALGKGAELEVLHAYSDSALARMARMVEEASKRKAPTEIFMRKIARIYTPAVMALSVLILLVPALVSVFSPEYPYVFGDWLYRALVFLVISCPCALVVSIPLSYFAGIGSCSKKGILFKGGNGLDAATGLDGIVFDKTGTLTTGSFIVREIFAGPGFDTRTLLLLLASVENTSRHPLARAIVAEASKRGLRLLETGEVAEFAGLGVRAEVEGKEVLAGSAEWMRKEGISLPDGSGRREASVFCAVDGRLAGYVELADEVRPEAKDAVNALKRMGVRPLAVFSGDSPAKTEALADVLGLEKAFGGLLPEDKVLHLQRFKAQGLKVAFVGDGINDSPVLAASDLGIAMGRLGSDAAIGTADVVLQTDNLMSLPGVFSLARRTRKTVWQNIGMIFGFKFLIMILGVLDMASLWAAVFADTGVALLAVMNSVRSVWNPKERD